PEHPILTPDGWVEAQNLAVGDQVAVGVPQGVRPVPTFDLADLPYLEALEVETDQDAIRARKPSAYQHSGRQARWGHRYLELTPDLARLCGYYVAEGTIGPDDRYVRFTLGKGETTYQQDIAELVQMSFGITPKKQESSLGEWANVDVYNRPMAVWFRTHFGHGASLKRIPTWLLYADPEIQHAFLVGLFRGDGMFSEHAYMVQGRRSPKTFRTLRLTLANPSLIHQVWQMLLRLGYNPNIRTVDTTYVTPNASETAQISLPPLTSRQLAESAFGVHLPAPDERYLRQHVSRQGNHVYFTIQRIETVPYSGPVYNCEVDGDHTYVTEGVAVHNCFVLPIKDDMGRDPAGIFSTLRVAALIQQTGGGNGFSFSRLRPKGARVSSSRGVATGPVGFLRVYDKAFGEIAQGGCLLPETLVFTSEGLLRLDEMIDPRQPGWQPHGLEVATDEGWRPSPHGYNNGVKPVLRVQTRQGLTLTGTPDHKVKVMTPAGPAWRPLRELQAGDSLIVQLGQHRGRLRALRKPTLRHGNQIEPNLPSILNEELAFFLGYLAGDGFVAGGETDYRLGVTVAHDSYLMEEMPRLMARLFGVQVHATGKPGDNSTTFFVDNRAVKEFLILNGLVKSSSRSVHVPRLIRTSPPEIVAVYLRGLFEADGTVSHGYPSLITTSARLAEEVATLLIGLGCPIGLRRRPAGKGHWGDAAMYEVRIRSHVGLRAWQQRIGCDPRSRFAVCMAWEPDLDRESSYPLPHAGYWLQPVLEAITLPQVDKRGRGQGRKWRSTEPQLRRQLLRYLRQERALTHSAYQTLAETHPLFAAHAPEVDALWFVEVERVEPAGEALTLDLEVEGNHTYLAYGLVTHNTRRGANMAVLRVDHPDILEFIRCKGEEGDITNFNISVGITDEFMRAVEADEEYDLINPQDGTVWKRLRAREVFDEIVRHAHRNGEPGVLFLDTANRSNPVPHLYELEATNPCGEQWLGDYENCCLGSVNLARHATPEGGVDWAKLRETVELATRFLDNVVDANKYVPAVPEIEAAARRARRIGLGIMGLGDLMFHGGIRYGSPEGEEFAAQVMEFVRFHAMRTSIELAKERGPFPAIGGSIYDPEDLKWRPPTPLTPYSRDFGRPPLDWGEIVRGIKAYGIRNAAQTTVAPTGTIATVSGCEAYGCEPTFALSYVRHFKDGDRDVELTYTSPLFIQALERAGLDEETRQRIIEQVSVTGSCQGIAEVPEEIRHTFVVASDITAEEHVRMQAAIQAFVDNSISKTVTFPENATENDINRAYQLAWRLGCKGLTVYVTGSREKVVLETKKTKAAKQGAVQVEPRRPRPTELRGTTYRTPTPLGTAYITINENGHHDPFEVFANVGKAGSDTAAVAEAIGRLISLILRMPSPLSAQERLTEVIDQLSGIGG
ncbi:MAG TPA: adenosylcobalamin-dependent ribonucleoside-diphosphate reductase, partial [Anaerolineae bacterium]|nr:adenosylcobalamin-dependent ribonucleoside-diphosphate reductase [Anaerolineae bacterium]